MYIGNWILDTWVWTLRTLDWPGLGKLVSPLEARMDHKHLWLTRKNLPGNKVHQDRWCTVVFTTLCWCLPSCAAVHCCIVMDEVLVAALQGWFAKVTLDTGQSYLHHTTTTNWETWQRHWISINCWRLLVILEIAKVAADHPAHASDEQEKLAAHLRGNQSIGVFFHWTVFHLDSMHCITFFRATGQNWWTDMFPGVPALPLTEVLVPM